MAVARLGVLEEGRCRRRSAASSSGRYLSKKDSSVTYYKRERVSVKYVGTVPRYRT